MPITKARLLIIDDDPAIREILSVLLTGVGYEVRTAEDGFTALAEIRKEVPDILLSDLNMPGMSGFELLRQVRIRFPGIQTIAMSAMFSNGEIPPGVEADAFYQKGTRMGSLLGIMRSLPQEGNVGQWKSEDWMPAQAPPQVGTDAMEADRTVTCLNCMRMISEVQNQTVSQIQDIVCADCSSLIQAAFARSADRGSALQSHESLEAALPELDEMQQSITEVEGKRTHASQRRRENGFTV